ncbi:MAG: hypothetical protein CMQ41_14515 [Gammaproteobacteria bacterium]|nr:hypothetical protein [Gammaproteobacteria bacterium]|tara:strand:+ start:693 stop:1703 length:1011 start_codon:yes stop_codon:yes gene_type:complete
MRIPLLVKWLLSFGVSCVASFGFAQLRFLDRLPQHIFDVAPPSARVVGLPGNMSYLQRDCRVISTGNLRERIINTAIQEWAYFGYNIYDLTHTRDDNPNYRRRPWTRPTIAANEAVRVADSIAGYWSATPDSAWILELQNQSWNARGPASRWRNPWSAAFVSWVMCESGLGDSRRFRRAIAHHSYIDQAIKARDSNDVLSAYYAYDAGEKAIEPGDMLCRGSRPNYQTLDARRLQIGIGARTHCDIVVKLDDVNQQIMVIGGNVRAWVRLKLLPAEINEDGLLETARYNGRSIFAHLKLRADSVPSNALEQSPTLRSLNCEAKSALVAIADFLDCS